MEQHTVAAPRYQVLPHKAREVPPGYVANMRDCPIYQWSLVSAL
jgi:hypothetical protein